MMGSGIRVMSADAAETAAGDVVEASRMRYRMAVYTTAANVVSKGLSLLVLYVSVPLTISYLGNERFGVWMTLASFISFLGFLDFGIGSSLINEVVHFTAREARDRLKRLISHALLLLSVIGAVMFVLMILAARVTDLQVLFNVSGKVDPRELLRAADTLAALIGLSLPIVGLQRIFLGLQRAFLYHLLLAVASLLSLALLFVLAHRHAGIAALLLATYGFQLLAGLPLLAILWRHQMVGGFDRHEFFHDTRELLRHGVLFFILSVGGAVAWDSDFLIISRVVGAGAVAVYAVAVRLFQLVETPLQMVNTPLWSAYADAMVHGSHGFLRRTLGRAMLLTTFAAVAGTTVLVLFHAAIVRVWIHQAVILPAPLVIAMAFWYVIRAIGNCFGMYLNGVRVVKPQVVLVVGFCILALPLKVFGVQRYDLPGLVLANLLSYVVCIVIPYLTIYRETWFRHLRSVQT